MYFKFCFGWFFAERDVTSRQGRQALDLLTSDRTVLLAKAQQLHGHPGCEVKEAIASTSEMTRLLEMSHLLHYVYTPLLFLPKWRYKAHSTRLRGGSGDQNNSLESHVSESIAALPSTEGADRKKLRISAIEEREHSSILKSYMGDYLRYLKTMGFSRVRTKEDGLDPKKAFFQTRSKDGKSSNAKEMMINTYFVKKSLVNGTLFFQVGMCEPFVYMKFYGLENRDLTAVTNAKSNALSIEILDIQKSIHMHSFTFDFHLRTIDQLVSGKPMFRKGYHLVHFLEDFMSYYNKGPNFARNAIHKGSIDISCTQEWINANQLYNYVLSHETVYGLTVVRMEPIYIEEIESNLELDYALVRHSTYKLKQSEDVNVTLVVSYDKKNAKPADSLSLNFYILISMKEINPTSANNEGQSGIFRTVTPDLLQSRQASSDADIQSEKVNWIGYYSTHEQSMESMMRLQASNTEIELLGVFRKASVHCRRDQLWKSLHDAECDYDDFSELLAFVHTEPIHAPLLRKRLDMGQGQRDWFKALMKLLSSKYAKNHRWLQSQDTEHLVILSQHNMDMALVVTMDLHSGLADLNVINRFAEVGNNLSSIKNASFEIAEGLFNDVCFHMWQDQF